MTIAIAKVGFITSSLGIGGYFKIPRRWTSEAKRVRKVSTPGGPRHTKGAKPSCDCMYLGTFRFHGNYLLPELIPSSHRKKTMPQEGNHPIIWRCSSCQGSLHLLSLLIQLLSPFGQRCSHYTSPRITLLMLWTSNESWFQLAGQKEPPLLCYKMVTVPGLIIRYKINTVTDNRISSC